jgi:hypothetical protein
MSIWYKKNELARRYAAFYSASQLAGGFGGLLGELFFFTSWSPLNITAGAMLSGLSGRSGLAAWKWLFLSEPFEGGPLLTYSRGVHNNLLLFHRIVSLPALPAPYRG